MQQLAGQPEVTSGGASGADVIVRHFRHIVLWPLQLISDKPGRGIGRHDQLMEKLAPVGLWKLVEDEFGDKNTELQERHYREFVSFLPHVQRFLYGDAPGAARSLSYGEAPLRTYRRGDIAKVRLTLHAGAAPVICDVAHIDLIFFYDVDAVILAFEICADNLPLQVAQDIIYRFGRAYPPGWDADGVALNCPDLVEWLAKDGSVVASSDYRDRHRYLAFVGERRAPCIAAHWSHVLRPFVSSAGDEPGPLRFRQIEYYRMPCMSYLIFDDIGALTRADTVRLALASAPGASDELPFSAEYLNNFEETHCYDRFRAGGRGGGTDTRFLCCGHALTIVASGASPDLYDNERGLLGQFRHQYFLLFLIAHLHKGALLMLSDRLVAAIKRLDVMNRHSIRAFRRDIYALQESFLRFAQRYYFEDVSDQAQTRDLYRMLRKHLATDRLYQEIRSEVFDMQQYLDSDLLRRQSGSMLRLTVVTIMGLVGTISTGFLGMNLIDETAAPIPSKLMYFGLVTATALALTALTIVFSRPIAGVFDWLSGEQRR